MTIGMTPGAFPLVAWALDAIASQSFEYEGWPYPAAKPGACN
jgi:hypothetical protein